MPRVTRLPRPTLAVAPTMGRRATGLARTRRPVAPRFAFAMLVAALGAAAVLSTDAAASATSPKLSRQTTSLVTLRHAPTKFSARAPRGFKLRVTSGAYRIQGTGVTVTVRVVRTSQDAAGFGDTLRRAGDTVVKRTAGATRFRLLSDRGAKRTNILVVRRTADLVVTTAVYAKRRTDLAAIASRIATSVRGGTSAGRLMPLTPYRTVDGGATGWVPSEPDWTIGGTQGRLEGSSPRGNFLLGTTFDVYYPGVFAPGSIPAGSVEHPFVNAADALTNVWPRINQAVGINMTDVRPRRLLADMTLPTFRSSGMVVYDFKIGGKPFVGVANLATEDRLSATGTFFWQMYISMIAVPADADPTVGAALRLVWRSWNPSGAIAARNEQARQILTEINGTWQAVSEFRSRTADQQSRDVSCLLRTGAFVDDNARQLGLPPLRDCDSTYVRTGP